MIFATMILPCKRVFDTGKSMASVLFYPMNACFLGQLIGVTPTKYFHFLKLTFLKFLGLP